MGLRGKPGAATSTARGVPKVDPLAAPSVLTRLAAMVATSRSGVALAGWYLASVVPRIEPALDRWSGGRLTSLPIAPVLFLHATGARTGQERVTLLTYFTDGDDVILIGSNFGRMRQPAWYHNVRSQPEVVLRARGREGRYLIREAGERERERLWYLATRCFPPLSIYEGMAGSRTIPLMRCVPLE